MNTRTESEITIYSSRRRPIVTVPIRKESKRVWKLMDSDYIELRFDLARPVVIDLGAYIDDELFGRFVLCDEQQCSINKSNGAYQYTIQFRNRYWQLNNHVFCFCHVRENTVDEYYRKETDWSLTDTLDAQLAEVMKNISTLGYTGYSYTIHTEDIDTAGEAYLMQYNGTHIIDALKAIASQWECEWWTEVTEQTVVFHFGKCQTDDEPVVLEYGTNCETITADKSNTVHANRVWAFGGTRNVPPTYRRSLWLEVTRQSEIPTYGQLSYDEQREMLLPMFANPQREETSHVSIDTGEAREVSVNGRGLATYTLNFDVVTQPITETNIVTMIRDSEYDFDLEVNSGYSIRFVFDTYTHDKTIDFVEKVTLYATTGNIDYEVFSASYNRQFVISRQAPGYQVLSSDDENDGGLTLGTERYRIEQYYNGYDSGGNTMRIRKTYKAEETGNYTLKVVRTLTATTSGGWYYEGIIGSNEQFTYTEIGHVSGSVSSYDGSSYSVPATDKQGNEYTLVFNPASAGEYSDEYYAFKAKRDGAYISLSLGDKFHIAESELVYTEVPYSYYTDNIDDPSALKRIGERRIELPDSFADEDCEVVDGYMQVKGVTNATAKEEAIVFDEQYPRMLLTVGEISSVDMETETEPMADTSVRTWKWTQYTITPSEMFALKPSWLLPNVDLQVKFLTRADAILIDPDFDGTGAEYRLAGMTFNVNLLDDDPDANGNSRYTIVRNENYGAALPNTSLRPSIGDPFIVVGWNVRAMGATGLVEEAERSVARKTAEYLRAIMYKQLTYTCELMSDTLLNQDGSFDLLTPGRTAKVIYPAITQGRERFITRDSKEFFSKIDLSNFEPFIVRATGQTSRVIAYELKLDIPYDTPKYTIGESEAYSRLKNIEKEITKLQ